MNPLQPDNPFSQFKARQLLVWFFVISLLMGFVFGLISEPINLDLNEPIVTYIFYCLVLSLVCFLSIKRFRKLNINPKNIIGEFPSRYRWFILASVVCFVILFSIGSLLLSYYFLVSVSPTVAESYLNSLTEDANAVSNFPIFYRLIELFSLIVVAPITEEFIFRGILLHRWCSKWGIVPGILISSILFGFLHPNPIGLSVFGLVMALLYIKSRTLFIPVIAHAFNNIIAVVLQTVSFGAGEAENRIIYSNLIPGLLYVFISAPFLVYFIYKNFPSRTTLLPYFANQQLRKS